MRVLATGEGADARPSASTLREGLAWLRGARPGDTVVVFLAGHGKALSQGNRSEYYYLLPDAASFADLEDPQLRALRAFSSTQLADALTAIPARKQVVILDTCEAGSADVALSEKRELSSDAIRAHVQARDRTGAWFLAGAAADRPSYEASRYGRGVLTYALLEALLGEALEADQVQVGRWFDYAEDKVPTYAQGVGGVQRPFVRRGESGFPLGALPAPVRAQLPVGRAREVVVMPAVTAAGNAPDRARLGAKVAERLRALADATDAPLVYFDTDAFDGAWQVVGTYAPDPAGGLRFTESSGTATATRCGTSCPRRGCPRERIAGRWSLGRGGSGM